MNQDDCCSRGAILSINNQEVVFTSALITKQADKYGENKIVALVTFSNHSEGGRFGSMLTSSRHPRLMVYIFVLIKKRDVCFEVASLVLHK